MLLLLISAVISAAAVITCLTVDTSSGTTIFSGLAGLFVSMFLIGFLVRKKITAVQNELQEVLMAGQKRITRKVQQFQSKPGGNIKFIQRQIEADQKTVCQEALDFTARLEPFKMWTLTMGRQLATMRLQFFYQLKEFEQVDAILAAGGLFRGPMMLEPMAIAMKMARQYKNGDIAGAEKSFKWHIKWFKGDRGTLLYGLMSWIFMKEGESEKARQLLDKAKEITANPTLASNWELLSNCKDKSFSNAGLGEEWYGLYLENPPNPKQQRMRGDARGGRGF
jgi:hypothetical protein